MTENFNQQSEPANVISQQPQVAVRGLSLQTTVIGMLLVMIIATLAYLWFVERRARIDAQALTSKVAQANNLLFNAMERGAPGLVAPVQPEEITSEVVLDANKLPAKVISAAAGKRLGFVPGEVVVIDSAAKSQPSSQPAVAPE